MVHFFKSCGFLASNFTKNELPHSYVSKILTENFRISIFYNTTQWLLFNKLSQFYWIGLLIVIFTIGF